MYRSLSIIGFFLFSLVAQATDFVAPNQKILGAEQPIAAGELVDLSLSQVMPTENLQSSSYAWKVFDEKTGQEKKFRDYQDGIFFGAGIQDRKYRVIVAVTYLFVVKQADGKITEVATKSAILSVEVVVQGILPTPPPAPPDPPPAPTPPPMPPPDPTPTFPDGQFKAAKFIYDAATVKVAAGPKRAAASIALATSFRGIASAIRAGAIKTEKDVLAKTKASNDTALAANGGIDPWEPFSDDLQNFIYDTYKAGKLSLVTDYAALWEELALGLEKVK